MSTTTTPSRDGANLSSNDNAMIWGGVAFGTKTVPGQAPTRYQEFFVGTKKQFEQIGLECKDSELNPIIGPLEKCVRDSQRQQKPSKFH